MHQPYYRNILTGDCVQPWVRLHGIHSYYDLMKLYAEFEDVGVNINFVPSLLKQLRDYTENDASDRFLEYTLVDAKELTPEQKIFILRNFFMANHERMIKPYPRYWKLLKQRGASINNLDLQEAIRYFSWKDYLDIQVFYNLVWFGFKAREEHPEIERMLSNPASGHIFTEEDKKTVIDLQKEVLKKLLHVIKNCPKNIELNTTPFFHPILPLLINTDTAKRCMPNASLPEHFSVAKHAEFQLNHGITYFEQTVGYKPKGLWPAEGSVSPEVIPLFAKAGIDWIATDEGILSLSGVKGKREDYLYQPYIAEHDSSQVKMVFRDRELSDLISFDYAKMPSEDAANDLVGRIDAIAKKTSVKNPLITVLLDGENPWETYEQNGKLFLTSLVHQLRKSHIKPVIISSYISENPPKQKLTHLFSGSWINSNYAIWIGKPQKNQGWNYIKRTVSELGKKLDGILDNPNRSEKDLLALESFGAACGSDWFWWFDDDFASEFKSDFDKIFRMHLKNAFTLLGRDIPVFLYEPIHKYQDNAEKQHGLMLPQGFIYPSIEGINTSFFEWANAVRINVGGNRGTMGQSDELIDTIYFGFNTEDFFLRIDSLKKNVTFALKDGEEVVIYIHDNNKKYKLQLFFEKGRYQMKFIDSPEEGYKNGTHTVKFGVKSVFEMGLNFKELGFVPGEKITIILTVVRHGIEARHYSHLNFLVPDEGYERQMWSV